MTESIACISQATTILDLIKKIYENGLKFFYYVKILVKFCYFRLEIWIENGALAIPDTTYGTN